MVEVLGEKKMALEEKVAELEEAVADLEALQVRKIFSKHYLKNCCLNNHPFV